MESPETFHLCVTCPREMFVNFIVSIFTLQAFTLSVGNLFHLCTVLYEN